MRKLVKVEHALLGLKVAANGGGFSKEDIDQMINDRLAQGYNELDVFPVRTQFNDQGAPSDYLQLYIFKQYVEEVERQLPPAEDVAQAILGAPVEAKKSKKDAA